MRYLYGFAMPRASIPYTPETAPFYLINDLSSVRCAMIFRVDKIKKITPPTTIWWER